MKYLLILITALLFSSCSTTPYPQEELNASPDLLLHKYRTDPEKAYRYVNSQNANMVLRPDENYTILHAAAFQRNFQLVRALVENGANPGVKARWPYDSGGFSEYNRTPATEALMWGRRDIAGYLTERSGENLDQLVSEAEADVRRAHAEARIGGMKLIRDVIEFDRSLP